jgi:hypothetical protein
LLSADRQYDSLAGRITGHTAAPIDLCLGNKGVRLRATRAD